MNTIMYNVGFNCSLFHKWTLQAFCNNKGNGHDSCRNIKSNFNIQLYSNDINPNYINQPKKRMTSASPGAERRKILKSSGGLHQNTASRLTLRRSVCCCWSSLLFSLPLLLCTQCVQVKTPQTVRRAELPCRSHNDLKPQILTTMESFSANRRLHFTISWIMRRIQGTNHTDPI